MQHVAPLAKALEIPRAVVARIVVEMGRGEHYAGEPELVELRAARGGTAAPVAISPVVRIGIEPAAVR